MKPLSKDINNVTIKIGDIVRFAADPIVDINNSHYCVININGSLFDGIVIVPLDSVQSNTSELLELRVFSSWLEILPSSILVNPR